MQRAVQSGSKRTTIRFAELKLKRYSVPLSVQLHSICIIEYSHISFCTNFKRPFFYSLINSYFFIWVISSWVLGFSFFSSLVESMLFSFMQAAYLKQLVCLCLDLSLTLYGNFTQCQYQREFTDTKYLS